MASTWGARHGKPGYDSLRTGLTYHDVWSMMADDSEDSSNWRYNKRGTVLGMWHQLKLQFYEQAVDSGMEP